MINLNSVKTKNRKRVGRGISAGGGKTAGRGTKGQKSRAGHNIPRRFEGGQTPLSMRLPKLSGFKSVHKKAIVITLDLISKNYKNGDTVNHESLVEKKLIKSSDKVKILNTGKLSVKVSLGDDVKTSKSAEGLFISKKVDPSRLGSLAETDKSEAPLINKEDALKTSVKKPTTKTKKVESGK